MAAPDRRSRRGGAGSAGEGAHHPRAARQHGSGALLVSRSVRRAARRRRLSQDRARVSHHRARSYPGDGLRPAQRGQALHHPDRHALRQCRQARRLGRGRARRALLRRRRIRGAKLRGAGVQAHRLAPDRDALAGLPRACRTATAMRLQRARRKGWWRPDAARIYSGFTPDAFTIAGHRRISSARKAA